MDLGGEVVPVNSQPAVGEETELFSSLEVVQNNVAEIPGLHLSDPAVVVPDLQTHQVSQRPCKKGGGQNPRNAIVKENIHFSTVIKKVSNDPFLKKFFLESERVRT